MSFLDYNKIQDGGRRDFEKEENRKISTAIRDVFTNSLVKPQILFIKKLQAIYHGLCGSNKLLYKRCAFSMGEAKFQPHSSHISIFLKLKMKKHIRGTNPFAIFGKDRFTGGV